MYTPKAFLNINYNKEEANIYKLVDIISSIQSKISFLLKSMEHNKKNELFQKLSLIEDEILKNKKKINNYISKTKKKEIYFKKMKFNNELIIKKVDNELEEINKRIYNILSNGKDSDKEIYQISNDNMGKIIEQKKNEDKLRDLNIDYNSIIVIYQKILNILETNINKKYQLNEKLKMLEEEKNMIEEKILENISKKESFEEVSKIYLLKFFNEILFLNLKTLEENSVENNNINNNKINNTIEPSNGAYSLLLNNKNNYLNNNYNIKITKENLKLYLYELSIININDLCNEISIQLILSVNSCLKNIFLYNKTSPNSLLQNSENQINNLNSSNLGTKIFNSKESNSIISVISSKIKKEIFTFMNSISVIPKENNNFQKLFDDFLLNLSKNVVNYLNHYYSPKIIIMTKENNSVDFPSNISLLSLYFKIVFKKFYLDKVIQNESDFLNNQYSKIEKSINNLLELAIANINKLNSKKLVYDRKISEIKHNKQLLQDKLINEDHVSMKDKAYFELTKKSNELMENKKEINDEFNMLENEYEKENQNIYIKILNREKNLKKLEEEKRIIEDKIAKKNKVILNEIEKLKKIIEDKFKLIEGQINLYKKKYGNNFDLYDRFIEKINKSLRLTSKSLMNKNNILLNRTFSYNFYSPKNQINTNNFANNTFYKLNNNYNYNGAKTDTKNLIKKQRPFSKDSIYNLRKYN